MSQNFHRFSELFAQLGLPNGESDIRGFIITHSPLPHAVALSDALFWTPSQAAFLREELLKDADWTEMIDQLNSALRSA